MQQTAVLRNVISSSAVSLLVRSVSHGSLASLGIDAAVFCAAECHFLLSHHQCLWDWLAMAAGFGYFDGDAADCGSARRFSYIAVIKACEKGQQWHQALGLLASMQQIAVLRNVSSYSAVVSACDKCLQWQTCVSWH